MSTPEERIAAKALIEAMIAGVELTKDLDGAVRVNPIPCPYCETISATFDEAKAHDGVCPKHPGVKRAIAAEARIVELERDRARLDSGQVSLGGCHYTEVDLRAAIDKHMERKG